MKEKRFIAHLVYVQDITKQLFANLRKRGVYARINMLRGAIEEAMDSSVKPKNGEWIGYAYCSPEIDWVADANDDKSAVGVFIHCDGKPEVEEIIFSVASSMNLKAERAGCLFGYIKILMLEEKKKPKRVCVAVADTKTGKITVGEMSEKTNGLVVGASTAKFSVPEMEGFQNIYVNFSDFDKVLKEGCHVYVVSEDIQKVISNLWGELSGRASKLNTELQRYNDMIMKLSKIDDKFEAYSAFREAYAEDSGKSE